MVISHLFCDICKKEFKYPEILTKHFHPELEIDGVPINFWSPVCRFDNKTKIALTPNPRKKGIAQFCNYLPNNLLNIKSLGEGNTPLVKCNSLSTSLGFNVFLKDESTNPTASFKDRGMPLLLADAKIKGKKRIGVPSTGNAAISLANYARIYEIEPIVFIPKTISKEKDSTIKKIAKIVYDDDIIKSWNHFFRYCNENPDIYNGFPTNSIPYQQGIKTITYELFLQMNGELPDWLVIPCGSGGNFVSQYQACLDLFNLGLISKFPKFVSVQVEGADPITVGFNKKQMDKVVILDKMVESKAEGIASDTCFNYFKIMNILHKTNGIALSINDSDIEAVTGWSHLEYTSLSVFAVLNKLKSIVKNNDSVVLVGTAGKDK